jgi:light-harvesting complex II chlorophyll a/b binding protein 2
MAASALHQTTSFLGTAPRRDDLVRSVGDFGGRITMRRTVKSAPQSIWYVLSYCILFVPWLSPASCIYT